MIQRRDVMAEIIDKCKKEGKELSESQLKELAKIQNEIDATYKSINESYEKFCIPKILIKNETLDSFDRGSIYEIKLEK
jgi:glutamine synthetase